MKKAISYLFTSLTAFFGVVAIVLVYITHNNSLDTYNKNVPYQLLSNYTKDKISLAHLNFEEWVGGDETVDYDRDVLKILKETHRLLDDAYEGKTTDIGFFNLANEPKIKIFLKKATTSLESLTTLTQRRKDLKLIQNESKEETIQVGVGSEIENRYDAMFMDLRSTMNDLNTFIIQKSYNDVNRVQYTFFITLILIGGMISFILVIELRTSRKNRLITIESKRNLEYELTRMNKFTEFIERLSDGDYKVRLELDIKKDNLAQSLVRMRDKMKNSAQEEETRKEEVRQKNWITQGLSILGDIIHQSSGNLNELSTLIIKNLIRYINANQGGIFILNEENKNDIYLELVAAYAYDRRKFLKKKIHIGEGLVGACAAEKETIYMTELPNNYVKITSGLGTSNPNVLLLVPLKLEDKIFGVIEIASFNKMETYEIRFVEQIAESIASTLSTVKINIRTAELLELSNIQAEEKSVREEELRQNVEELKAIQEERERKKTEMQGLLNAIDHSTLRAEFTLEGQLITANENYLKAMESNIETLQGKDIREFISEKEQQTFERVWSQVCFGKQHREIVMRQKGKDTFWWLISYTPIESTHGDYDKILFLANDISIQKELELKAHSIAEELKSHEKELLQQQEELRKANTKQRETEINLQKLLKDTEMREKEQRQKNREAAIQEQVLKDRIEGLQAESALYFKEKTELLKKYNEIKKLL